MAATDIPNQPELSALINVLPSPPASRQDTNPTTPLKIKYGAHKASEAALSHVSTSPNDLLFPKCDRAMILDLESYPEAIRKAILSHDMSKLIAHRFVGGSSRPSKCPAFASSSQKDQRASIWRSDCAGARCCSLNEAAGSAGCHSEVSAADAGKSLADFDQISLEANDTHLERKAAATCNTNVTSQRPAQAREGEGKRDGAGKLTWSPDPAYANSPFFGCAKWKAGDPTTPGHPQAHKFIKTPREYISMHVSWALQGGPVMDLTDSAAGEAGRESCQLILPKNSHGKKCPNPMHMLAPDIDHGRRCPVTLKMMTIPKGDEDPLGLREKVAVFVACGGSHNHAAPPVMEQPYLVEGAVEGAAITDHTPPSAIAIEATEATQAALASSTPQHLTPIARSRKVRAVAQALQARARKLTRREAEIAHAVAQTLRNDKHARKVSASNGKARAFLYEDAILKRWALTSGMRMADVSFKMTSSYPEGNARKAHKNDMLSMSCRDSATNQTITLMRALLDGHISAQERQYIFEEIFAAMLRLAPSFIPHFLREGEGELRGPNAKAPLKGLTMGFDAAAARGIAMAMQKTWGLPFSIADIVSLMLAGCQAHGKRGLSRLFGNDTSHYLRKRLARLVEGSGARQEAHETLGKVDRALGKKGRDWASWVKSELRALMMFPCLRLSDGSSARKDANIEEAQHLKDLITGGRNISVTATVSRCRSLDASANSKVLKILQGMTTVGNTIPQTALNTQRKREHRARKRAATDESSDTSSGPRKRAKKSAAAVARDKVRKDFEDMKEMFAHQAKMMSQLIALQTGAALKSKPGPAQSIPVTQPEPEKQFI